MKPIILFDIDRTLFDTDAFTREYREKFIKYLDVSAEKLEKILAKYQQGLPHHTDYVPDEFIKHLINSLNLSKQQKIYDKLHNLFFEQENFSKSKYPEVASVLASLKDHYTLGIVSAGQPAYQKIKLAKLALTDYFDPKLIYILHRKTEPASLALLPENATIVDDDPTVIDVICSQKEKTFYPVWINRKSIAVHPRCRTIHSLSELV